MFFIAQGTPPPPPPPGLFGMLLPMLFLGSIVGVILALIARRKGSNPLVWFVIGLIPFGGFLAGLVLASRPDVSLLRRIWALEDKVANGPEARSAPQPPPVPMV